jgi:hypothetical protein
MSWISEWREERGRADHSSGGKEGMFECSTCRNTIPERGGGGGEREKERGGDQSRQTLGSFGEALLSNFAHQARAFPRLQDSLLALLGLCFE